MIPVIIYILFWGIWLVENYKRYGLNSSSILIGLYFSSAIAQLILVLYHPEYSERKLYIDATLYHLLTSILFMAPIISHGNKLQISNLYISPKLFRQVSYSLIVIGFLTIVLSISGIRNVLSFENFEGARQDAIWGDDDKSFYSYGLIGYIATIGMITPMFAIFMAFYRLFKEKNSDLIFYMLIITSLSGAFMNLTIAGRDGLVRWFMFVICNIAIYKSYFSIKSIPFILKVIFVIIVVFVFLFFLLITYSRFGKGEDAIMSIVDYLGMSFYRFSEIFHGVGTNYLFGFNSLFPIFPGGMNSLDIAKLNLNFSTSSFHTFIGSFVLNVGTFWTIIMALFFNISYRLSHRIISYKLNNFFSYLIFYQIVYIGIFYFVYALLAWQCSFLIIYILSKPYKFKHSTVYR